MTRTRRPNAHREEAEQEAFFRWVELQMGAYPDLEAAFSVPNGAFLAGSDPVARARRAARLKRQGLRPGVPDILIPVPRGAYTGLAIELKAPGGRPTAEQLDWLERFRRQRWRAEVRVGWVAASNLTVAYLTRGRMDPP